MADAGTADRYSIYGDVDVDALLSVARPWAPFRIWRKGDPVAGGRVATTGVVGYPCSDHPGP